MGGGPGDALMKPTDPAGAAFIVVTTSIGFLFVGLWFGFVRRRVPLRGGGYATGGAAIIWGLLFVGFGVAALVVTIQELRRAL